MQVVMNMELAFSSTCEHAFSPAPFVELLSKAFSESVKWPCGVFPLK